MKREEIAFLNKDGRAVKEYRCSACRRLFFKGILQEARIEIKCQTCKRINIFITRKNLQ